MVYTDFGVEPTILNVSFREHSRYRLAESCEVICAGNENILDLSVFQIIQHGSPEFRCPYDAAKAFIGRKLPKILGLQKIAPDDVILRPLLLKR